MIFKRKGQCFLSNFILPSLSNIVKDSPRFLKFLYHQTSCRLSPPLTTPLLLPNQMQWTLFVSSICNTYRDGKKLQQRILFPEKIYSSFCSFKSSLIKVSTSEKSRYTDANRMYATLSSFFSSSNTASPSSSDDTSRSIRLT